MERGSVGVSKEMSLYTQISETSSSDEDLAASDLVQVIVPGHLHPKGRLERGSEAVPRT